jgi:hypothetical protein
MPVYRPLGEEILSPNQYNLRAENEPDRVLKTAPTPPGQVLKAPEPPLPSGAESFDISAVAPATVPAHPFQPVAAGKPLNMVLRRVYTGEYPKKGIFSKNKPMLISSTIKDVTTTAAGARAINILKKSVESNSVFNGPGANDEGTALVYYSPAVTSPLITISLTMIFEDFDKELFDSVSGLFAAVSSVPILMPAAAYLVGASSIVKLAGDVGSQIINGHPVLDENIQIDFQFGGGALPQPGYWILTSGTLDSSKYQFDPIRGLIQQSNSQPYDGDDPVIVVTIDGSAVDGVANFAPLVASSSILGKFFNQKDGSEVATDTILSAVKLVNDLSYRKKAEEATAKAAALKDGDPEKQKLLDAIAAFNQNIGEDRLRLPQGKTTAGATS